MKFLFRGPKAAVSRVEDFFSVKKGVCHQEMLEAMDPVAQLEMLSHIVAIKRNKPVV